MSEKSIKGFFEVVQKKENGVTVQDLHTKNKYFVKEKTALPKLKIGSVLSTVLIPSGDIYVFPRIIDVYDPDDKKHKGIIETIKDYFSGEYIKKAIEMQKEVCEAAKQFFGCTDPVFKNGKEAENAMNNFMEWRVTKWKVLGKNKTPSELWLEEHDHLPDVRIFKFPKELYNAEKIGIIFDELAGFYFLPYYGPIKELFEGDYKKVPNYEVLARELAHNDEYVPAFILKKLINKNPTQAVIVFGSVFKEIKSIEDLLSFLEKKRVDWNKQPKPSIIPIKM